VNCSDSTSTAFKPHSLLAFSRRLRPRKVFEKGRVSVIGFSPVVAFAALPYVGLRETVRAAVDRLRVPQSGGFLVGVHRRRHESVCIERAKHLEIAEWCALPSPRPEAHRLTHDICSHPAMKVHADIPAGSNCNITLNDTEADYLLRHWPALRAAASAKQVSLFVATDSRDAAGDAALLRHPSPKLGVASAFTLAQADAACFKHAALSDTQLMLMDMWALVLADVHWGSVWSTCDDIVVHWRIGQRRADYSSAPNECYAGWYNRTVVPASMRTARFG